jgi:predicted FMN-binding regulatory protein PaiB
MQFYPAYDQTDSREVQAFVEGTPSCRLLTRSPEDRLHYGIFNPVCEGTDIFLHLNRNDEQVQDLRADPRALVAIEDFQCVIPSYWVDSNYAGAATSYFPYAEFDCDVEIAQTDEALREILTKLMKHHQPEGGYAGLASSPDLYRRSFDTLAIVRLKPRATRTKWKLGQTRSADARRKIVIELRKRGEPGDLRAADEVEKWLKRETL